MFKSKKNTQNQEKLLETNNNEQLYNSYNLGEQNLEHDFNNFQNSIKDINTLNISQKIGEYAASQQNINASEYSQNEYTQEQNYENYYYQNEFNQQVPNNYDNYIQDYSNIEENNYNNEYQMEYSNIESYDTNYNVNDYNTSVNEMNNYDVNNNFEEHNMYQEVVYNIENPTNENIVENNTLYKPSEEEIQMGKCQHCSTCNHKDNCEIYLNIKQKEEEMARLEREFEEKLRLERERLKELELLQAQQLEQQNVEYYNGDFNVETAVQNKMEENQFSEMYIEQNGTPQNQNFSSESTNIEDDHQHYQFRDYLSSDISLVGLADPKERFMANLLDSLILFVLYGLTYLLMLHDSFMNLVDMIMLNNNNIYTFSMLSPYMTRIVSFLCVTFIIKFGYNIFVPLYVYKGQTIGKKIKKIQIKPANEDILDLDFNMLFKREILGKFISGLIFGFGYIRMLRKEDKKCYHDIYADTKVIKD